MGFDKFHCHFNNFDGFGGSEAEFFCRLQPCGPPEFMGTTRLIDIVQVDQDKILIEYANGDIADGIAVEDMRGNGLRTLRHTLKLTAHPMDIRKFQLGGLIVKADFEAATLGTDIEGTALA